MALDPALATALRLALALLLAWAALHKLRDLAGFRRVLADYRVLPAALLPAAAAGLAAAELAVAVALALPAWARAGGAAAAGLLALYAGAMALNLARGRRHIDCGCLGAGARRPLGPALVARNALLVAAAAACALPVGARAWVALDLVTVAAGTATLGILYAACDVALENAARLRAWRGAA